MSVGNKSRERVRRGKKTKSRLKMRRRDWRRVSNRQVSGEG